MSESLPADLTRRIHTAWRAFGRWRHTRPFWGGLMILIAGLEIVASTQLSLGNLQIRFGLEGLQAIVIPVILITAGLLIWFMPVHRVFYGVIALVVALYSLVGVNLGGFFIGMLLGIVGGSLAIAWSPLEPAGGPPSPNDEPTTEHSDGVWDDLHQSQDPQDDSIVPGKRDDRGSGTVRLAVAGAAAGALIVAAIVPAGAVHPLFSQTTEGDCEPEPAPSEGPDPTADPSASPDPSRTPSPDPSSTPDPAATSDPNLVEGIVSALTQILDPAGDRCEPAQEPTGNPGADPTTDPTAQPTTEQPTPNTDGTAEEEPADETDQLGLPEGFELPEDAVLTTPRTLDSENLPVVAASPGRLTGSSITMTGLVYEGNVDLPTADGPLTVMKFTMDSSVVTDFSLAVDAMGETLLTTTDELTISGDVTFYTDRFVGRLLGFKLTFLPETPPPFTLPLMVFTDPEIRLASVEADLLDTEPIMNQRQAG